MPFSLRESLDWLYEEGTRFAFGPKDTEPLWLTDPRTPIPRNTYRRAVILLTDPSGMIFQRFRGQIEEHMLKTAAEGGYRLLKMQPIQIPDYSGWPELREVDHQLYTAYIASDIATRTLGEFSALMFGAPIIMGLEDVSLSERATLDALWIARGEAEDIVENIETPTIKHKLDVWPLVGVGVLAAALGLGLWAMTTEFKRGHRYA